MGRKRLCPRPDQGLHPLYPASHASGLPGVDSYVTVVHNDTHTRVVLKFACWLGSVSSVCVLGIYHYVHFGLAKNFSLLCLLLLFHRFYDSSVLVKSLPGKNISEMTYLF